ncbi:hypothetical protein D3C80_2078770 [compost metagenome]
MQMNFRLLQNDRAASWGKVRKHQHRQDLRNSNAYIAQIAGNAIAVNDQFVAI